MIMDLFNSSLGLTYSLSNKYELASDIWGKDFYYLGSHPIFDGREKIGERPFLALSSHDLSVSSESVDENRGEGLRRFFVGIPCLSWKVIDREGFPLLALFTSSWMPCSSLQVHGLPYNARYLGLLIEASTDQVILLEALIRDQDLYLDKASVILDRFLDAAISLRYDNQPLPLEGLSLFDLWQELDLPKLLPDKRNRSFSAPEQTYRLVLQKDLQPVAQSVFVRLLGEKEKSWGAIRSYVHHKNYSTYCRALHMVEELESLGGFQTKFSTNEFTGGFLNSQYPILALYAFACRFTDWLSAEGAWDPDEVWGRKHSPMQMYHSIEPEVFYKNWSKDCKTGKFEGLWADEMGPVFYLPTLLADWFEESCDPKKVSIKSLEKLQGDLALLEPVMNLITKDLIREKEQGRLHPVFETVLNTWSALAFAAQTPFLLLPKQDVSLLGSSDLNI